MADSVLFSRVMEEYGTREHGKKSDRASVQETLVEDKAKDADQDKSTATDKLIQDEERLVGAVSGAVYRKYFKFAGGYTRLFIILALIAAFQGAQGAYLSYVRMTEVYTDLSSVSGQYDLPGTVDTTKSPWIHTS